MLPPPNLLAIRVHIGSLARTCGAAWSNKHEQQPVQNARRTATSLADRFADLVGARLVAVWKAGGGRLVSNAELASKPLVLAATGNAVNVPSLLVARLWPDRAWGGGEPPPPPPPPLSPMPGTK